MTQPFNAQPIIDGLYDFQRATVELAFDRLYLAPDSSRRFLVADETGLGKTHVARGVIARTIEHLERRTDLKRIDVVYVCSNADIADQNLGKLVVTGDHRATPATRLTMLVAESALLHSATQDTLKPVTFVAFTPATSFEFGWQTGKAEERAVIFKLLEEHLRLQGADTTALKRILQGTVGSLDGFHAYIERLLQRTNGQWEPEIRAAFLASFDRSPTRPKLRTLIDAVRYRGALSSEQKDEARRITAALRQLLARASVSALEPDLVILDEFQRFRTLLTTESEAGRLAQHLFDQPDARVLLLSATPYKAFTYAEENAVGEDHYSDLVRTLGFLGNGQPDIAEVEGALRELRRCTLAGQSIAEQRSLLEASLRRLMCRTERAALGGDGMLTSKTHSAEEIEGQDLAGYVALHEIAEALDAPLTVEYWKSAPYFGNFLDGYKIGEKLKQALKDPVQRTEIAPLVRHLQRLRRRQIESFQPIDWGNARLRSLARESIESGSWRLLWIPPSLPYHAFGGPFAAPAVQGLTKRLVFSSWVAAPTAIASLISYEVDRLIHAGVERFENTPEARRSVTSRLAYRLDGDRPASMSVLSLFWPSPTMAASADPLDAMREGRTHNGIDAVLDWAKARVAPLVGGNGTSRVSAAAAWHWAAPLLADGNTEVGQALADLDSSTIVDTLAGGSEDEQEDVGSGNRILAEHAALARSTLLGASPDAERPDDLVDAAALLALAAPGNIAWRALSRVHSSNSQTSLQGRWRAAAVLASGLRNLFNRPEVTLLLDQLDPGPDAYWQKVARYCLQGNLQACLDEYLHHLHEAESHDTATDAGLLALAEAARRAITVRAARYVAFDLEASQGRPIPFLSRFALRFGNIRQDQDDVRLPEVRAAFNSPFWPFVLATTSIGQEGVDFHWWCHAVVHWNLPANPVDFEQREGRVNRFKGHAVRRNVAAAFSQAAFAPDERDPWSAVFKAAVQARRPEATDLEPYWIFPGAACVERHLLCYPLSRDEGRWAELQEVLALYRLAFGQPRQDDLVALLARRGVAANQQLINELRLDLSALHAASHRSAEPRSIEERPTATRTARS